MIADLLTIAAIVVGVLFCFLVLYLPIAVARIEKHQADQVALLREIRDQTAPAAAREDVLHLTQDA